MKIAHIFSTKGYLIAESYIRFIKENFQDDYHEFIVIGQDFDHSINSFPRNCSDLKYIASYKDNYHEIIETFKSFDKLIYHSLSLPVKAQLALLINNELMKKIYWVAWGYDLYQWKLESNSLKKKIANLIFYAFRKKIRNFIGIFPPDIEHYERTINSKSSTFYANYVLGLYNPFYMNSVVSETLEEKINYEKCINILIGHSSTPVLNHIEVLNELLKFKNENILIHIPLSYGNREYGNEVEIYSKKLFDKKVICYRELMSTEKYHDFLSSIDIAIFNTPRQIGIGNISPLLFMQKKIYFPEDSVMYGYFVKEGISISNYNEMVNMNFFQFINPSNMRAGKEYIIKTELKKDVKIKMWDTIFKSPIDRGMNNGE